MNGLFISYEFRKTTDQEDPEYQLQELGTDSYWILMEFIGTGVSVIFYVC